MEEKEEEEEERVEVEEDKWWNMEDRSELLVGRWCL